MLNYNSEKQQYEDSETKEIYIGHVSGRLQRVKDGRFYDFYEHCTICGESYVVRSDDKSDSRDKCCGKCRQSKKHFSDEKWNQQSRRTSQTLKSQNRTGKNSPSYMGVGRENARWDTYGILEEYGEAVRKGKKEADGLIIEVVEAQCQTCGKWYHPTYNQVRHRKEYLEKDSSSTRSRFYCSDSCRYKARTSKGAVLQSTVEPVRTSSKYGGYVYGFQESNDGPIKIGMTDHENPMIEIKRYDKGSKPLQPLILIKEKDAFTLEKHILHVEFDEKRGRGEFFNISLSNLIEVLEDLGYRQIENNFPEHYGVPESCLVYEY